MANDFSGDSDVVALYNFESGALTTDSKGDNDLTAYNTPTADTTNYKQGSASASFDTDNDEYFAIDDSDLSSDFPLKDGSTNDTFSVLFWFRMPGTLQSGTQGLVCKYDFDAGDYRSFFITVYNNDGMRVGIGYNSGASYEYMYNSGDVGLTASRWSHCKVTYDDRDWTLRVWDDHGDTELFSDSGTTTNAVTILDKDWTVGRRSDSAYDVMFDGNIDELIFFKRVVSDDDQDDIIDGTYSAAAGGTTMPIFLHHYKMAGGL